MADFNSPAAAFSHQGKGNYQDVEASESDESDVPAGIDEAGDDIKAAAREGDYQTARLAAARIIGDADDSTVEEAREVLAEMFPEGVDYEASVNTVASHVSAIKDAAAEGGDTTVVRGAIQIVECINNRD